MEELLMSSRCLSQPQSMQRRIPDQSLSFRNSSVKKLMRLSKERVKKPLVRPQDPKIAELILQHKWHSV